MGHCAEPHGKAANKQRLFEAEQFLSRYDMKGLRLYFRDADRLEVSFCLCLYSCMAEAAVLYSYTENNTKRRR